jgi:uracil phosphoribosyltransferase
MRMHVVDHPLVAHKLTKLRDQRTDSPSFRRLVDELVTLLAYEATRDMATASVTVVTPLAITTGAHISSHQAVIVPVLRAGLGMLDGMQRLLPMAEVGFVGVLRNETTLQPAPYATRLPADLTGRRCFVLDPMLATGGTMLSTIRFLAERGATEVTVICLLAAPEGVKALEAEFGEDDNAPRVSIVTAALDERLDKNGYVVPGLGDSGDRLYGLAH